MRPSCALVILILLAPLALPPSSIEAREPLGRSAPRVEQTKDDATVAPRVGSLASRGGRAERTFGSYREIGGQAYAVLDNIWTFDHGHGEAAEGWEIRDLSAGTVDTAWRRIADPEWTTRNPAHGGPAPVIAGSGSAWVGLYEDEAGLLCWQGGLGYGNDWCQNFTSPPLHYDGTGNVAISFGYWCNLEPDFDYARIYLKTLPGGTESQITSFNGTASGTYNGSILAALFGGATEFSIVFRMESDGGWSDEDGDFDTIEGPFAFDNMTLANNIVEGNQSWDFETDLEGFTATNCVTAFGAFLQVNTVDYYEALPDFIPAPESPGDCVDLAGNVLALHDGAHEHPQGSRIMALSPVVDLTGITGIDELRADLDYYLYLPMNDGVMVRRGWIYYPYTCPGSGGTAWSPRVGDAAWNWAPGACGSGSSDATAYLPALTEVEKVRFVYEVLADCAGFGIPPTDCTGESNASPLIDNIAVVISGASLDIPEDGACCLADGICYQLLESMCDIYGGTWHDGASCSPLPPCPAPPTEPVPAASGLINPEPWHEWISEYQEPEGIPIQAHIPEHLGEIEHVEFYYSTDGGTSWELIGDDLSGYEPSLDTQDTTVVMMGCGWSADFDVPDTTVSGPIQLKTVAYPVAGGPAENVVSYMYDKAPPSMGRVNIDDFVLVDRDALGIEVYAADGGEVSRIIVHLEQMQENFVKGIPGICQQAHSTTHCAPTAAAQCLKYFEQAGDDSVAGGLDDYHLTGALATYMSTNYAVSGTLPSNWVGGMTEWLAQYAPDYTVRYFVHYTCLDGCSNWTEETDWTRIRNELEMCHDVLVGVFWDGGGGHAITLNEITHPPLPDGSYLVGYKDPWTGASESGHLDPATGHFTEMSGAGGGGGGKIGVTMIVKPSEGAIDEGAPGDPIYDGLPLGGPPYAIEIPLPEEGYWFVHITVVNPEGHSNLITRVAEYRDTSGDEDPRAPLLATYMRPCRPNPFQERTEIAFAVPRSTQVRIAVYDVTGRMVRSIVDGVIDPGIHKVHWDGRDSRERRVSSGIYYVEMQTADYEKARTVMMIR